MNDFNDFPKKNEINDLGANDIRNDINPKYNGNTNFKSYKSARNKGGFMSYLAVGLVGSIIGGSILTGAAIYMLPNTAMFRNTPLYQSLVSSTVENNQVENTNTSNTGTTSTSTTIIPATSTVNGLSITDIVKKVGPAVVGISTYQGSTLYAEGTGIIFSTDGYIVTNYHVVSSGDNYKINLSNNKQVVAKVVNYDSTLDLAVMKITETIQVPGVVEFGDSDKLQVGELSVAIGNPLGQELSNSVTSGVISALNRQIDSQSTNQSPNTRQTQTQQVGTLSQTYIQTDAAINEGNSGGPLINALGQVIGINSVKIGGSGVEGLGFAIPINVVKAKVQDLVKPMLVIGISSIDVNQSTSRRYGIPVGVYIKEVTAFGAAEKAGLKAADVITKFDGTAVSTINELNTLKAKHSAGDTIKLEITRDGNVISVDLKLIAPTN